MLIECLSPSPSPGSLINLSALPTLTVVLVYISVYMLTIIDWMRFCMFGPVVLGLGLSQLRIIPVIILAVS